MKKLYSHKGPTSKVHPSSSSFNPLLSALPTALIALASTLSSDDQQVLAYLLSSGSHQQHHHRKKNNNFFSQDNNTFSCMQQNHNHNHPPDLSCSCFGCYKSFWARWDASPNRQLIHLILDTFEESLQSKPKHKSKSKSKKKTKDDNNNNNKDDGDDEIALPALPQLEMKSNNDHDGHDDKYGDDDDAKQTEEGKSSVTRFMSWVFGITT